VNNQVTIFKSIWSIFSTLSLIDVLDISILSFIIYKFVKIIRETRASQLAKGIVFLLVAYLFCDFMHLKAMEFLLSVILNNGFIAILIMFQPELRRTLEKVGRTSVSKISFLSDRSPERISKWRLAINEICEVCESFSATATGALIVIEQKTRLGEELETGTVMKSIPSVQLFENIFYPKAPLHDGAAIIRDGMVLAAGCFLPKPQREQFINKNLGSRHRAAIGMSENSDAIVVVVSEETGIISVAHNGELTRNYTSKSLNKLLSDLIIPDEIEKENQKNLPFLSDLERIVHEQKLFKRKK